MMSMMTEKRVEVDQEDDQIVERVVTTAVMNRIVMIVDVVVTASIVSVETINISDIFRRYLWAGGERLRNGCLRN